MIGEVGLAVVLLVAAALLGETVVRLTAQPLGFRPDNLAVVRTGPLRFIPNAAERGELPSLLLERIRGVPGVTAAAATSAAPFGGNFNALSIEVEGRPGENLVARRYRVSDAYFETLGVQPIRGRGFRGSDAGGAPVAVVSQEMERRYYGGNPLGRRLRVNQEWFTIIGSVPDTKLLTYDEEIVPAFFVLTRGPGVNEILVRTAASPEAVIPALRAAVTAVDPRLAVAMIETMETLMRATVANERYQAILSSAFGGAALVLAAVGVYALLRRRVDERRREIGVRLALGARPADIMRGVVGEGAGLVAVGLILGTAAALGVGQLMHAQLYGIEPTAPHIFAFAGAALGIATLAATFVPALLASRIDPIITVRAD